MRAIASALVIMAGANLWIAGADRPLTPLWFTDLTQLTAGAGAFLVLAGFACFLFAFSADKPKSPGSWPEPRE